jgi:sugar/nucleoside kinase (ribokinase family)
MASAIQVLLDKGPRVIIIKRAEHGATLATRDMLFHVPAFPTDKVVDPTGAGDSFAGGVIGYLSKHGTDEDSLRQSLVYGSVMGSFCVEEFGTNRLQEIGGKEIDSRVESLKKMMVL